MNIHPFNGILKLLIKENLTPLLPLPLQLLALGLSIFKTLWKTSLSAL